MKTKKILTVISSLVLAASLSATSFAGCNKCEHAYTWTTEVESTCVAEGRERGKCGICGDVITRKTAVNADNHAYGDWHIDPPTESEDGLATKTCSLNAAHKTEVELPAITANYEGYDFAELTKAPTAVEAGSLHLELKNDIEDIKFDVELARRELTSVEDAVLLGSSLGGMVRSASGSMTDSDSAVGSTYWNFSAEFGDNYTHVVNEGDQTEAWLSLDDEGVPFGVSITKLSNGQYTDPAVMQSITEKHLLGYGYSSGAQGDNLRTFGAEDTLLSYYNRAMTASEKGKAIKYTDDFMINNKGEVTAEFSYSYYENPFFARYKMEFTLYPSGAIKTLKLETKVIRSYMFATSASGEYLFDDEGDVIFAEEYESDPTTKAPLYERDSKGNIIYDGVKTDSAGNVLHDARGDEIPRPKPQAGTKTGWYSDEHSEISKRVLIYNEQVLKTDSDVVPENPYKSDVLYIKTFDVKYQNRIVGEEPITVPSNERVDFTFENILPTTATLAYDPVSLYIRTPMRDIPLTMNYSDNPDYPMIGGFSYDSTAKRYTAYINSRYAKAPITLVFKTKSGRAEKAITVEFEKAAPSTIAAQAYIYSDAGGVISYNWAEYSYEKSLTVYAGQPLYVKAVASAAESEYTDTSFEATVYPESGLNITNDLELNGEKVSLLEATAPGTYRVYLEYTKKSTSPDAQRFAQFELNVVEAPAISGLLKGEYGATLRYVKVGNDIRSAELKATFNYGNNWRIGTITLDVGGNVCTYSFNYNEAEKKLDVTKTGGVDSETFDFTFAINEAYRLTVTHSTGFPGITETVALLPVAAAE